LGITGIKSSTACSRLHCWPALGRSGLASQQMLEGMLFRRACFGRAFQSVSSEQPAISKTDGEDTQ